MQNLACCVLANELLKASSDPLEERPGGDSIVSFFIVSTVKDSGPDDLTRQECITRICLAAELRPNFEQTHAGEPDKRKRRDLSGDNVKSGSLFNTESMKV